MLSPNFLRVCVMLSGCLDQTKKKCKIQSEMKQMNGQFSGNGSEELPYSGDILQVENRINDTIYMVVHCK